MTHSDSDGMTCRANDHPGGGSTAADRKATIRKARELERAGERQAAAYCKAVSAVQAADRLARQARIDAASRYADRQADAARGWLR